MIINKGESDHHIRTLILNSNTRPRGSHPRILNPNPNWNRTFIRTLIRILILTLILILNETLIKP